MKYIVFIILSSLYFSVTKGQVVKSNASFTLRAAHGQPVPDSIQVTFNKGKISPLHAEYVKVIRNKDQSFSFSFSTEQSVSPFSIWIYYPTERNKWKKEILNAPTYYAEKSDKIEIEVAKGELVDNLRTNGTLTFSGKRAEKYKVAALLDQMKNTLYDKQMENCYKLFGRGSSASTGKIESMSYQESPEFENYLKSIFENVKIGGNSIQDTLAIYSKSLGGNVTSYFKNEFYAPIAFIVPIHWLYEQAKSSDMKEIISNFYFCKISELRPSISNDSANTLGHQFTWSKGLELMFELDYRNKGKGFPFRVQYEEIKRLENISLRDILITKFFEEAGYFQKYINNSDERDLCLNDALKIVSDPELNAALHRQLLFVKGSKMPDFSFSDMDGKFVKLSDLKNKVYILDFYFEGCGSCVAFAKRFENEIYPRFVDNPDFKILSVNTDLTRDRWLKAVNSGKYTHSTSINVSTGTEGCNHPILKYYEINAFPWVLLVDRNGRVLTFNVHSQSSVDLIRMIEAALNDKFKS